MVHDAWTEDRRYRERIARAVVPRPTHADRLVRTKGSGIYSRHRAAFAKRGIMFLTSDPAAAARRRGISHAWERDGQNWQTLPPRVSRSQLVSSIFVVGIQRVPRSPGSHGRVFHPTSLT